MDSPVRKWTMVVDLDKCTGCGACVIACHAENNVQIVSEREVTRRRGMHWIHIERYWTGTYPQVQAYFLPLLCQQCFRAPCEPVCPVYATNHSQFENLNLQVYNRCVGTRYCQNNDPYKVRFFNFFDPTFDEPLTNQLNPDVTVRSAGVMEKCTFCVQRIRRAEEKSLSTGIPVRDGDVIPACVQTCPPGALLFGDLYDPNSRISRLLENNSRQFRLLEELGTQPSVNYLKGGVSHVA
jgi:Fe-S-cluster-containing dehydrogenase component